MKRIPPVSAPRSTAVALACALVFAFGAHAQTRDADEAALQKARADLERAAERVAELSGRLGKPGQAPVVIERRVLRKPVLGVVLAPDTTAGVRIAGVTPDSGAAKAGLRAGDRVLSIDGKPLDAPSADARTEQARMLLAQLAPTRAVGVDYERDGKRAKASVTPRVAAPTAMLHGARSHGLSARVGAGDLGERFGDGAVGHATGTDAPKVRRIIRHEIRGPGAGDIEELELSTVPGVMPGVHREIIRLAPGGDCRGERCEMPLIAEAVRWNGLNLASVDAQLGRYFGTDRGVLVLSTPATDLGGLQSGDVIRTIDGKPVATPREAMSLLRGRPADSTVTVGYLRDRREATTRVRVPKLPSVRMPPAPPAAPAPPPAAPAPPAAMPAPAPSPAPPASAPTAGIA